MSKWGFQITSKEGNLTPEQVTTVEDALEELAALWGFGFEVDDSDPEVIVIRFT